MEPQVKRINGSFANISQRAVSSYRKALAEFGYVPAEGVSVESQRDLYSFFQNLYTHLFENPENFGLPVGPDASISEGEPNAKDKKQEVKRLLDRPRGVIAQGLDYLLLMGANGKVDYQALVVDGYKTWVKTAKVSKKFLQGLEDTGLVCTDVRDTAVLRSPAYPEMMPALKALAEGCSGYESGVVGKFLFAGCDFRALHGHEPQAPDLYRFFDGTDYECVMELHEYFSARNYRTEIGIGGPYAWTVKYQGDRKIKASPLYEVGYEERYALPLRMQIKCASTARLADLLPKQSQLLQDDFHHRANVCRGDDCAWCRNQKTLGPAVVTYNGDTRTLCWYTNPDIREVDAQAVELIEQYEQMHAGLGLEK